MKKNYRSLLVFFAIISLTVAVYYISTTYAKYLAAANGTTEAGVAGWKITVNENSIKNGETVENLVTPVFPGNENYAEGIIAPGAEGYFDLEMDFIGTEVSFNYTVEVLSATDNDVPDFKITRFEIEEEEGELDENGKVSEDIYYADEVEGRNVRVYVGWIDEGDEQKMDNVADTAVTKKENAKGSLKVVVKFTQLKKTN